ncbi:MAG: hypothetical protein QOJ46_99 [bacterium]
MPTARRSLTGAAVAALALAMPAAPAAADGLPLPVEESPNGVSSPDGASRYLSVTVGGRTAILAQKAATGSVTSRLQLAGRFGIPLVAYDSTAGGLSADGHTLVLIRPRAGFPRRTTTFAVLSTKRWLRLRKIVSLPGDFSYDALSPDGRSLFLINYLSRRDPTKYRVRVYDLEHNRLEPRAIVDPREDPDEMNGIPLSRAMSPDGRWAYTLYQGAAGKPFIHALDTVGRKAVCIDLDDPALAAGNLSEMRLRLAAHGARLDLRRKGTLEATVDTATFRVRSGPEAVQQARASDVDGNRPGPSLLWPTLMAALLGAGYLAIRLTAYLRTRSRRAAASAAPGAPSPADPSQLTGALAGRRAAARRE